MREFKAGNKYDVGGTTFEIMKRTKIYNHKDCEYFYSHPYEVEA